jgi:hypothetical protein
MTFPWRCLAGAIVSLFGFSAPARAQEGFASNQLNAPARPSPFWGLEPATELRDAYSIGLRSSYLNGPVQFALAAPSETATRVPVVSHLWLIEGTFALRLAEGLDVGVALPWNAVQTGSGIGTVTGATRDLPTTAIGDPRFSVGYGVETESFAVRGFGVVSLPLGSPEAFSGEGNAHGDLGVALSYLDHEFELSLDLRAQLRAPRTLGLYRLGSGMRVAAGFRYRPTPLASVSLEGYLAPSFESQPSALDEESAGSPLPAELLLGGQLALDRYTLGLGLGAGLPLGSRSSLTGGGGALSPTVPAFRALLDFRATF